MDPIDTRQDEIERYAFHEMDPQERAAFEQKLQEEPELKAELIRFRELQADLRLLEESEFRDDLRDIADELREEPVKVRSFRSGRYWIAAAAAILLILIPTVILLRGNAGPEALYAEYYEAYPDLISNRGSAADIPQGAMDAYNAGDFAAALPIFRDHLRNNPQDENGRFYASIAEIEAGDPLLAAQQLQPLIDNSVVYKTTAIWYAGLAYLKGNQVDQARQTLEKLTKYENSYRDRATEILTELAD